MTIIIQILSEIISKIWINKAHGKIPSIIYFFIGCNIISAFSGTLFFCQESLLFWVFSVLKYFQLTWSESPASYAKILDDRMFEIVDFYFYSSKNLLSNYPSFGVNSFLILVAIKLS